MTCASCGTDNPGGAKFCNACGAALSPACGACGTANPPGARFCSECGEPLTGDSAAPKRQAAAPAAPSTLAERRLVSVLFVDLVGFTAASEARDAEDTRELLTRYFDVARTTIERYGGSVEKFIGDAVMAVWGAPVAQEDDAERAVRAALDLVAAVPTLDPELRARAGVLTGEAAVTIGAEAQGLVAGDLVNTASRIQGAAEPGTVLAGEPTKRASEAAIAYDDAGAHELKGKSAPVQLWRALRVVAGKKGALRSTGLEAPFVGRDRELRVVKELFHGSADQRRAQLALVTGVPGIGKSRLAWEFEKYVDGLADDIFWHRGRCLSYGEGVAYWALAEMVRMRCRILDDDEPESARPKLRLALEEYIIDSAERAWVEPRLAHLIGLEEGVPGDEENLFSAWRILFERLADVSPTILVFEDVQWADAGLLDFLEYLLDWSRGHPLFVLALARPEFAEKRASWGGAKRSFSSLYLEPLSGAAMDDLLTGLVPGLPDDLRDRILDRAEGIPLYAVETVRMLLDRGLLARAGNVYRATGAVESLEVPETLHALVAARLDALPPAERRLVECGAVLGKTFTKQGLAAVSGVPEAELDSLLAGLLGKEIISVQADPRSPELGQYSFLQDIVKRVSYETISRRERKAKHLAAARFLASSWSVDEDEISEVLAAHFLDAYEAAPDAPDAQEIRDKARAMLVRAGDRAASLAATAEAEWAYARAAQLSDSPLIQGELLERSGLAAYAGARADEAAARFERAIELFEAAGATHPAARVSARLAEVMWDRGRIERGLERMDRAFAVLSQEEPDADLAALAAELGRFMFFAGQTDVAAERIERALTIAETLALPETIAQAINTKGAMLQAAGRPVEGRALIRNALDVALEHDKPSAALRAYYNLVDCSLHADEFETSVALVRDALALARRVGNRRWERAFLANVYPLYVVGDWDAITNREEALSDEGLTQTRIAVATMMSAIVPVRINRGELEDAQRSRSLFAELKRSADVQEQGQVYGAEAALLMAEGKPAEALASAERALETRDKTGVNETIKESFATAVEAALAMDDPTRAEAHLALVDALPPGRASRFLQAHALRFHARLAAFHGRSGDPGALFAQASDGFRGLGCRFHLAVTLLEHAEWLVAGGGEAEALLAEAVETFERLTARPWLARAQRLTGDRREPRAVTAGP